MSVAFVTGGSGFVGSNLVRRLIAGGSETHVLSRNNAPDRLRGLDVRVHQGDLSDPAALGRILQEVRPDQVYHLAAASPSAATSTS